MYFMVLFQQEVTIQYLLCESALYEFLVFSTTDFEFL